MKVPREKQKILLIMPPYYRLFKDTYSGIGYPLSLGYLAGTIHKETDWMVKVYNADYTPNAEAHLMEYLSGPGFYRYLDILQNLDNPIWQEIRSKIKEFNPAVVGLYCCTQNFTSARIVAKITKAVSPETSIVIGGPHPTFIGRDSLSDPSLDIAVIGEGERTIVDLLIALSTGRPLSDVKGILFRNRDTIHENPPRELIENLDTLIFPHQYASIVLKDYHMYSPHDFQCIMATRGCPYNCMFCGSRFIWGRNVRFRSVANVIEEIKSLQSMGISHVRFDDDTFGVNREYLFQLCEALIQHCPGITWGCEIHVNLVDDRTISLMKEAGCRYIQIGIESGNNRILKEIRKGITIEMASEAAHIIRRQGIQVSAFFIIGFPQETEEDIMDTFQAMKKIPGIIIFNIFTPYPGTEGYEICKEEGLIGDEFDISLYNHQSPENCFCLHIRREQFRRIAEEMAMYVDQHNAIWISRPFFSLDTYYRIRSRGISGNVRIAGQQLRKYLSPHSTK